MKEKIINQILNHLKQELDSIKAAAQAAHSAAINEQSIAETQYDTLAIEAGYLAEGQANRASQIQADIQQLTTLVLKSYSTDDAINIGSLITLSQDQGKSTQNYFICSVAAGLKITINNTIVYVITPQSPMGQALMNRYLDDDIKIEMTNKTINAEILAVS